MNVRGKKKKIKTCIILFSMKNLSHNSLCAWSCQGYGNNNTGIIFERQFKTSFP